MTAEQLRQELFAALAQVAPEVAPASLDGARPLRDQVELDSMDFLRFIVALNQRLGVEVPERDYSRLTSLDACVEYLSARLGGTQGSAPAVTA